MMDSLPHRFSSRSVLFPTSMMMTSLPLSVLTSSIHFEVCWNEFTSVDGADTLTARHLRHPTPNHSSTLTRDVIDHHSHRGVAYVARNETPETLLPGGVPQLQPHLHRQTRAR